VDGCRWIEECKRGQFGEKVSRMTQARMNEELIEATCRGDSARFRQ